MENKETPEEWANRILKEDYHDKDFLKLVMFGRTDVDFDMNTPIKVTPVSDEFISAIKNKTDKDQHTTVEYLKLSEICQRYKHLMTEEELKKLLHIMEIICNKIRFFSSEEARIELERIVNSNDYRSSKRISPHRYYQCQHCSIEGKPIFHLTSKPHITIY